MQDRVSPGKIQEVQDEAGPLPRMEHQLLVLDQHTAPGSYLVTLSVHRLHDVVPPPQALPGVVQLVAGDGDLPGDHRVDHGPPVPHHEDPLGVGEDVGQVPAPLQSQGVFVTENPGWFSMLGDGLQHEGADGGVDDLAVHPGLDQALRLLLVPQPVLPHGEHPGDDPALLPAPYISVTVQDGSHQGCPSTHSPALNMINTYSVCQPMRGQYLGV